MNAFSRSRRFTAYVACCSPTGMRVFVPMLKEILTATATILDRQGKFGKIPDILGGKSIQELLESGRLHFKVDAKYPQAVSITTILDQVSTFGNSRWEILRNEGDGSAFFTSDYPACIEVRPDGIMNRVVPLAPDVAIRIFAGR